MDRPTRFIHKLLRGFLVGFAIALVVAFVAGATNVPKGESMAAAFYLGLLSGLTSFIVPIRERDPSSTAE